MSDREYTDKLGLVNLDIADVPFGYGERVEFNQVMLNNLRVLDANISGITTGSVNLFVSTTGDDLNPGTVTSPLRTIQAALNRVPKLIRHPVTISVDSGSYSGAMISGFLFDPASYTTGSWMVLQGAWQPFVPSAGPSSGTVSSSTIGSNSTIGWGYLTASLSPGWVANDLQGHHIRIMSGTGVNQVKVIAFNTSDTITICGGWTTNPDSTSQFEILDPATTLTPIFSEGDPDSLANSGSISQERLLVIQNTLTSFPTDENTPNDLVIQRFNFSGSTSSLRAIMLASPTAVTCRHMRGVTPCVPFTNYDGQMYVHECSIASGIYFYRVPSLISAAPLLYSVGNFVNNVSLFALPVAANGRYLIYGNFIKLPASGGGSMFATNIGAGPQDVIVYGTYVSGAAGTSNIVKNNNSSYTQSPTHNFSFFSCKVDGVQSVFDLNGPAYVLATGMVGSGNVNFVNVKRGTRVVVNSDVYLSSSNGIQVDNGGYISLDAFKALSPVVTGNLSYGTVVYSDF